jgi:IPT/TIG domain/Carboxypeptidase regulatory-like domain
MTANGQEAVWDGGRRFRRRRSRLLLLGVAVIMAILGIMVFAGAAMAAPSAGDKYPGISNNAQGSSSLLTATIGRELPQEPSRHATALGAQKTMAAAGTGSISGKVTNSSGTGLLGVEVDLYDSDFDLVDYTYTNSSGTYSFSLLPNISVLVGAFAETNYYGATTYIDEWYNNVAMPGNWDATGATWLNLATTSSRTNINFSLAAGKYIKGTVEDDSSNPLSGIWVDAFDLDGNYMTSGYTDDTGAYEIAGLPAGRYNIRTDAPGVYVDEWYDNDPVILDIDAANAAVIDVRSANSSGKNFQLGIAHSISGMVTSSSHVGLADVQVLLMPASGDSWVWVTTDETGSYEFDGLIPEQYLLATANDQGYIDEWYQNDPVPGDMAGDDATSVNISSGDATGIDFALDKGYTISGSVVDNLTSGPLADPGMVVTIYNGEGTVVAESLVGGPTDTTTYTTWALPGGTTYYAEVQDYAFGDYAGEWYDNVKASLYDHTSATPIPVGSADVTGINFRLDKLNEYDQTDGHIVYAGGHTSFASTPSYDGSYERLTGTGSSATIYFNGTRLDWIAMKGTSTGPAKVYVDDDPNPETVNLTATSASYQVDVWTTGYLSRGLHRVRIEWNATSGKYVTIDAVKIDGTIAYAPPSVSAVNPTSGTTLGGTSVVITGENLTGATEVMFGGTDAAHFTVDSATQITATSPAHEAGTVDVTVTTPTGTSATLAADHFTFTTPPPAPTVAGVSPTSGNTIGGTSVIITGTNLTGATAVSFGGTAATGFTADSATQITATSPAHAAGAVDITVTTPGGTSATSDADRFTYQALPVITSISPTSGTIDGGTLVTINGANLDGATKVTFGTDTAVITVVSGTQITVTTPAHAAGAVTVEVTTPTGSATTSYTYQDVPPVTRYDQTDTHIVKTGTWINYTSPASWSGTYGRSSTSGASATIWFKGTQLDWIAFEGTTTGKADVYVDGVKVTGSTPINLAASPAKYQQKVWSTGALPNGLHSVKIVRNSTSASGKFLTVDAVDIYGSIAAAPTKYQQTDLHIVKTGSWSNFASTSASGGSYSRSLASGASATITFNGSRLDWIAMKGTTTGYADVWVDGVKMTSTPINLTASSASYQVAVWSSGTLSDGVHTVQIVRNDALSGTTKYITLDAVDIWGTIQTPSA